MDWNHMEYGADVSVTCSLQSEGLFVGSLARLGQGDPEQEISAWACVVLACKQANGAGTFTSW